MTAPPHPSAPLVVDLDGTLIYSDLLWEAVFAFLKSRWREFWRLPMWLLRGRASFKDSLSGSISIDPERLPYDRGLLQSLADERSHGRTIVLATGSARRWAEQVAQHLGVFSHVHATDRACNLTSTRKAHELASSYGGKCFDYIGDCRADVPVWELSRNAYCVGRSFRLPDGRVTERVGSRRANTALGLLRSARPRQWLKNLLVFLPMLAGHTLTVAAFAQSLAAFVAFSCCASSAYLLNDVLDVREDRRHPVKRARPVAAGVVGQPAAALASLLLAASGLALAAFLAPALALVVAVYLVATFCYSAAFKRWLMFDVVVLALLYCLRVLAGSASTRIVPSVWLLGFSFFLFLSLGLLKRHSELGALQRGGDPSPRGRGYRIEDTLVVGMLGINSAFVCVSILMLYLNSSSVQSLYATPVLLYAIPPLVVFWLGRLWLLSFRGEVADDPVMYVSTDLMSLLVLALAILAATVASF